MNLENPFRLEMSGARDIRTLGHFTIEALDNLAATVSGAWAQQHAIDGTHSDVTFALGSATAIDVGAGVWMGPTSLRGISGVDNDYDFRVGDPDGSYFEWDGSTHVLTVKGAITATSGTISGDLEIGTGGQFRSGATAYGTGTGYWLDYNGGTPRFRVGTTGANRISWDGTNITIVSDDVTIDGNGVAIVPDASGVAAGAAYKWTVSDGFLGSFGYEQASTGRFIEILASYDGADTTFNSDITIRADNSGSGGGDASLQVLATHTSSLIGLIAAAVEITATTTTISGVCDMNYLSITDGISAPSTSAGNALIYVDSGDGDLKVKFGDGTVKTIVTDT